MKRSSLEEDMECYIITTQLYFGSCFLDQKSCWFVNDELIYALQKAGQGKDLMKMSLLPSQSGVIPIV